MSAFHKEQKHGEGELPLGVREIDSPENKDTQKYRYFRILKALLDKVDCVATDSKLELGVDLFEVLPEISKDDNTLMLNPEIKPESPAEPETTETISGEEKMHVYALEKERKSDEDILMENSSEELYIPDSGKIDELLDYLSLVRKKNCDSRTGGQIKQKTPLSRKKGKGKMTKRRKRKTKRNKSRRKRK